VPVVCGAATAGAALATSHGWRVSVSGLLAFVPYFAWRSLAGGVDVAVRALLPSLPIAPSVARYTLRLPAQGPARVFFANTINLLPGTASVDLEDDVVVVHLLRDPEQTNADLRTLEAKVAALFGLTLGPNGRGDEAR
jgi:multicomponent Na+:H+ antiporter subunit E